MKKLFLFVVLAVLCLAPLAAQQAPKYNESELYYVNIPIEKVYPYNKGYAVVYRSGVNQLGTVYIPHSWFRHDLHKAELLKLGPGKRKPSMSIFYKEGEFHAVRLYVARHGSDSTWGIIGSNINIDDRFEGVETLDIKF
jgi:hypothetical protein